MTCQTYTSEHHSIKIDEVDPDALFIIERLQNEGYQAYLVGGGVRDLALGIKPKDFDIATSAKPEEIRRLFRNCLLIGRRFRLAHIRFGKKVIEVSTFRSGDTLSDSLIVRDNEWGTAEEDARRRDFTINGLFFDPSKGEVIDYVHGFSDLKKGLLRTIGSPVVRFKQDPVRMLRLLKFEARLGFAVEPETRLALVECRGEIIKSSQARLLEEILRMLESGFSKPFFSIMHQQGLLYPLFPKLCYFFENDPEDQVFSFLSEVDVMHKDPTEDKIDRAVLLGCLLYPILSKQVETEWLIDPKAIHLGTIHQDSSHLSNEVLQHFFLLPKKLKASLVATLTHQFRLTPLSKIKRRHLRAPRDPDFYTSLQLLAIRSRIEPALQKTYEEWKGVTVSHAPGIPAPRKKRRRRRRRSGGAPEGTDL